MMLWHPPPALEDQFDEHSLRQVQDPQEMKRMPQTKQSSMAPTNDGVTVGYEAWLWQMANALRDSMDAAEYRHVMLGLSVLTYSIFKFF